MNIKAIIDHLNKTRGYSIGDAYYSNIMLWEDWWRGFHAPFHQFVDKSGIAPIKRKLYTLGMAKKVPEDWASILLNEKTQIVIDDEVSSVFVQGAEADKGNGGVFGNNAFWRKGNELIEKAFYSGTGAFVVKLKGMAVTDKGEAISDPYASIRIEYLPAMHIIPLTVACGEIVEVAFVSETIQRGAPCVYIELHLLEGGEYVIHNEYHVTKNDYLAPADLPPGVAKTLRTGSDIPLFAIVSPNIVNNIRNNNGLGLSVYANALDNLQGVDLAFNNFCRDFRLGGKKVFYSDDMVRRLPDGTEITPDDVMQQLFVNIGDSPVDENGNNRLIQEYNPALRVAENREGIQAQLDYLSFKCGFGAKHYQFNGGTIVTATQYSGDKQELVQSAAKHYIAVEKALCSLVRAILWAGNEFLGAPVNPDAKITVNFEDSYIIDKESERLRDLQEVRDGLMQKWEYRVKWKGETEVKAKQMIAEGKSDAQLMDFE